MKPKTKDRILDAALELFNREGLEAVSTRRIAQALGISQGNLCYHYPQKDQLVEALYARLRDEFSRLFAQMQSRDLSLPALMIGSYEMFRVQYRYKFLMLDFVQVMRQYPAIQADFQALFKARQAEFAGFFAVLAAKGWLRAEIPPEQLANLIRLNFITGNFWMAEAEIQAELPEPEKPLFYARLQTSLIWPYLSPEGQARYAEARQALDAYLADAIKAATG